VRRQLAFALVASLPAAFAGGQESTATTPHPAITQPASVTVHYAGPGVTAPSMFPPDVSISLPRHCVALDGVVKLSALVDENGVPRSIQALHSDDARLDNFAIGLVAEQRFKPGTYNGAPAAVAIELTAALHTCALQAKKKTAQEDTMLTLSSHPFFRIAILNQPSASPESATRVPAASTASSVAADRRSGEISPPAAIFQPNPQYSKAARQKKTAGTCLIGATIDANGVPQDVRVVESLEPSLDHNSIETINTWRFNPALRDGTVPVPFEVTIAVTFWPQDKMFLSFTTIVPRPAGAIVSSAAPGSAKNISPPVPLNANEVQFDYSPYGRLAQITGLCVVAFMVDKDGLPKNVRVVKSLESSMDENAVTAVNELRFQPALKNGTTPVPAEVIMPIRFRPKVKITKTELFENALTAAVLIFFRI
jgi:TonB family protein